MELYISKEEVNSGRQKEFDYAKMVAIIFMVLIHVWEELTKINLDVMPEGFMHNMLQFCAGPLAAPMFMFSMGVGMMYSSHTTPKELFRRGVNLFITAYLLNFFRGGLAYILYAIYKKSFSLNMFLYLTLNGDILQFAGLSFMLVALLKKLKLHVLHMTGIAFMMQIAGVYLGRLFATEGNVVFFLGLFFKVPKMDFPLLQWFIYPCAGMLYANYLKHINNKDAFYKIIFGVCSVILISYGISLHFNNYDLKSIYALAGDVYYNQDFIKSSFNLIVLLFELSAFYMIFCRTTYKAIDALAGFASKNLNTIYIVQWILVGWTSLPIGRTLHPTFAICLGLAYIVLAFAITKIYIGIKKGSIQKK